MSFSGDFFIISGIMAQIFDLWNYGPKIHQNLRNYGYQFLGQNGTSPSHNGLSYPPPPLRAHLKWGPSIFSELTAVATVVNQIEHKNCTVVKDF